MTVYVGAPLCAEREAGAGERGRAGWQLRVRVRLPSRAPSGGKRLDLATVGANARRATEDSTTVAYLRTQDPATRFVPADPRSRRDRRRPYSQRRDARLRDAGGVAARR